MPDEVHNVITMMSTSEVSRLVESDYALEPTQVRLIANGVNDTYAVEVDATSFAFRIYGQTKPWIRGTGDLCFELDLLTHLRGLAAPVSYPVERRAGDTLGTWSSPTGDRYYALFSWCPGRPINTDVLTVEEGARLGAGLASIHVAADSFVSPHSRYSLDQETLLEWPLDRLRPALSEADPEDAHVIEDCADQVAHRLRDFDPGPTGWGLIHADPQVLNCHFTSDGAVTFFDFDLCGFGWRAYDIAYCLRHTGPVGDLRAEGIRSAVLDGYQSVRSMTEAEHRMLPILGQAAWIREGAIAGYGLPPSKLARLLREPYGAWE